MPVEVAESYVGKNGRVSWTLSPATDARVTPIPISAFFNGSK